MAEIVQEMSKNFKIVPKQLYFVFVSFWFFFCLCFFLGPKEIMPERFFRSCHLKGFSSDPRKIFQIMSL
jgi:hypothetical protein